MEVKDYITIGISSIAICFSFISLIFTSLNFKRNATKLKVEQINFYPNLLSGATPNKLYLDRNQSMDFWTVVPMVYLVVYLKIANSSHTGITISNFLINDNFQVSQINIEELKSQLSLSFFSSEESHKRNLAEFGQAIWMDMTSLDVNDYKVIKIGDRIESKSSIEGIFIVSGNWNLYNAVKNGINKLSIITPDKKFITYIEIDKTIIPKLPKIDSESS
ncbi:hypothetical protein HCJ13_03510 [Listeria booriae]|uniref:hypothetical protein n=1 Tax=Listeria booriae TaxID=1552123 RepID=UPI001626BECC|nr:hypothetical protein [Listeria booriae]MBC1649261.1 hypothetical protein [Listeria booriae]